MNKKCLFILGLFCISISILETAAYKIGGAYSVIASRVWVVFGFFYLFSSLYHFFRQSLVDLKEKYFAGFIAILFVTVVSLLNVNSFQYLNHEATNQLFAAFENINKADFNYTSSSFLGYPSRQYLITLLPSLLFGRSVLSVNMGYAYLFLLGILLFYTGLRQTLKGNRYGNILSSLAIVSTVSFPYTIEFLLHYEQVAIPFALTLQAIGWFLISSRNLSIFKIINLVWICSLLATSYTPGLGAWFLALIIISTKIFINIKINQYKAGFVWMSSFLVIIIFGINTFFPRHDLSFDIKNTQIATIEAKEDRILQGYELFFLSKPKAFLTPILFLPVMLYLFSSLVFLYGPIHLLISIWSILIIGASVYLNGYANPPPELSIHRAMIIIPVIITGIILVINNYLTTNVQQAKIKQNLYILFALIIISSLYYYHETTTTKSADIKTYLLEDIINQSRLLAEKNRNITNVVVFSHRTELVSTYDFLKYFFPASHFTQNTACEMEFSSPNNSLLYFEDVKCARGLFPNSLEILPGWFSYHVNNDSLEMIREVLRQK